MPASCCVALWFSRGYLFLGLPPDNNFDIIPHKDHQTFKVVWVFKHLALPKTREHRAVLDWFVWGQAINWRKTNKHKNTSRKPKNKNLRLKPRFLPQKLFVGFLELFLSGFISVCLLLYDSKFAYIKISVFVCFGKSNTQELAVKLHAFMSWPIQRVMPPGTTRIWSGGEHIPAENSASWIYAYN